MIRLLSAAAGLLALLPGVALAQGTILVTAAVLDRSDTTQNDPGIRAINIEECDATMEATVRLSLTGIPASETVLDFWRGEASSMCNDAAIRGDSTRTECTYLDMTPLDVNISGRTMINMYDVPARTFFQTATAGENLCDAATTGSYQIFVLATGSSRSTADVGSNYGTFNLEIDTQAPAQPQNARAQSGETTVGATWDLEGVSGLQEHRIYIDESGCDGTLVDGEPPPDGLEPARTVSGGSASASVDVSGIEPGSQVAVGIVAVDAAGNESPMAVVCADVVETMGFCEVYGNCPNGCSVSAPGARGAGGIVLLAVPALLMILRRRGAR